MVDDSTWVSSSARGNVSTVRVAVIGAVITGVLGIIGAAIAAWIDNPGPGKQPQPPVTTTGAAPAPTPTESTTVANPYVRAHDSLVLDDPLTTSNSRWNNDNPNGGTCEFTSDGYRVGATNHYHECYGRTSVTDFTYEVEFSLRDARVAGVFFRQSGPGKWYAANVGRSGLVWIDRDGTELVKGNVAALDTTPWHRLAVTAVGGELTFYVNGVRALTVTDTTYSSGTIGLITDGGDGTGPAGATLFRNARVWQ